MTKHSYLLFCLALIFSACSKAPEANYDEEKIPDYELPAICDYNCNTFEKWMNSRRAEVLKLFENEVYGALPEMEYSLTFREEILSKNYADSSGIIKQIRCFVQTEIGRDSFNILYIYPKGMQDIPVFVALNFRGNHTTDSLEYIDIHHRWVENNKKLGIEDHLSNEESRGSRSDRWPYESILKQGFGVATVYYGEFDPDFDDNFSNGLHRIFQDPDNKRNKQSPGSIAIWAKGMSLVCDYLVQDRIADTESIIALGHSRLGKTALWAGANDERFAAVISNNSGCGGAALSRRAIGERVGRINRSFPHWFNDRFTRYNEKENKLPVDQHMLLALIAPRPVYVASATEDRWADPRGEFLSLKEASQIYKLAGLTEEFPSQQPAPDVPWHGICGYHLRSGKHDLTEYDWLNYIKWCNIWLKGE